MFLIPRLLPASPAYSVLFSRSTLDDLDEKHAPNGRDARAHPLFTNVAASPSEMADFTGTSPVLHLCGSREPPFFTIFILILLVPFLYIFL